MISKFIGFTSISLVVALIVTILISYAMSTNTAVETANEEHDAIFSDIERLIACNDEKLAQIRAETDKIYLEKTRAFAEMIKLKPEIIEDFDELCKIQEYLGVDELHVCDDKGVLLWGTVKSFYGFDFATGEQTVPFLAALTNPSFELAQDPQPNGTTGTYFQYIGVARYDETGIVQIGMRPERLERELMAASPEKLMDSYNIGEKNRVLLINSDGVVVGDSKDISEGKKLSDMGLTLGVNSSGYGNLENVPVYWTTKQAGNYLLFCSVTQAALYSSRNSTLVVLTVSNVIIFALVLLIVTIIVSRQIIRPLYKVTESMTKLSNGDFNTKVEVYNSKEFGHLSDGINTMVDSIKSMLAKSNEMNSRLKNFIKEISNNVSLVEGSTKELFGESHLLSDNATSQNSSITTINDMLITVNISTGKNTEQAKTASEVSRLALQKADKGSEKMTEMVGAVKAIDEASQNISKVIKTIDDIAFQTNILALNAAVEAARAGEAGKGFAVVADEVRNLAAKSADAAKQTEALITSSIQKAQAGVQIANDTAQTINEVVENINKSAELMESIVTSSNEQSTAVDELSQKINLIAGGIESAAQSALRVTDESENLNSNAHEMSQLLGNLMID